MEVARSVAAWEASVGPLPPGTLPLGHAEHDGVLDEKVLFVQGLQCKAMKVEKRSGSSERA